MTSDTATESQRMLTLPDDLHDAIARALAAVPAARWLREAQQLSERYRAPRTSAERTSAERTSAERAIASGAIQALGYAALIMPATYAQLRGAIAATAARLPGWAPETMLDLGSGPGTALWAAAAQWPSLRALEAWEREPALIALGRDLARGSGSAPLQAARWERVDLVGDRRLEIGDWRLGAGGRGAEEGESERRREREKKGHAVSAKNLPPPDLATPRRFDLVVIGHVLNELEPAAQRQVVEAAWQLTDGLLLIVEPGTPAAFAVVRAARDSLLGAGAHTIAPCAHDQPCPLQDDWCHFPQRLKRPDFQRRARAAPSEWEDSKFAYAALARFPASAPIWGRVIREASSNKAYAETTISTRDGVARYRALKRHRDAFRQVKVLEWGTALEQALPEPIAQVEGTKGS